MLTSSTMLRDSVNQALKIKISNTVIVDFFTTALGQNLCRFLHRNSFFNSTIFTTVYDKFYIDKSAVPKTILP